MSEAFVPNKPETTVVVKITKREAVLIQKLRRYAFGKFLVYKASGVILRVEINDSQMIEENTEIDLS